MVERVLVAVDESAASRKAIEYVGRVFGHQSRPSAEITLFHCMEGLPPQFLNKPDDPTQARVLDEAMAAWATQGEVRSKQTLERYREMLAAAGIPVAHIHVKQVRQEARPEARRVVAALAILDEVKASGYTTVVVGRRGASSVPELYLGGVADKVCRHVTGATVWLID